MIIIIVLINDNLIISMVELELTHEEIHDDSF